MPIRVQVQGRGIVEFPDGMSEQDMRSALERLPPITRTGPKPPDLDANGRPLTITSFTPDSFVPDRPATSPRLLSSDPNAGRPNAGRLLSTDPNAGRSGQPLTIVKSEPLTITKSEPDDSFVADDQGLGAFVSHFAAQINPLPLGQLLPFPKALGGAGLDAPIQAAKNILQAQNDVKAKADAAWQRGNTGEALRHYAAWLAPVLGPIIDRAADEYQRGNFAAGTGDTLGLSASLFGPQAWQLAKESPLAGKMANAADKAAQSRAVKTMAPQVGPNKVRLGNQAANVGADVLQNTSAVTRSGMLGQAGAKLGDAYAALDAAYDKVPDTRMYPTGPVKAALQREIQNLSVSGIGGTVEPATRASRIAALRLAANEVDQLGSVTNLDNLRKLRIAWDEGAQAQFTPAVAQDYLKTRGGGAGWADARSALNDFIVSQHPELAPLNADAHLWKTAVDVMQAAEETDRVRPTVGRSIMARGLGAAVGGSLGATFGGSAEGSLGAAVGAIVGPSFERVIANLQPSAKIIVGRQMANLADAIRAGNVPRTQSLLASLSAMTRPALMKAAQVGAGQLTSPVTGSPMLAPQGSR